jgi:ribonuclease E
MAKKMLIDATHAEETRVVVVDGNKVEEFDFESQSKRQLAGNIYLAKVTRVEPSLQAAFVDYGGNRHGFLAFSEIHPDYYQIPVADREALIAEEKAYAESLAAEEEEEEKPRKVSRRRRSKSKAAKAKSDDVVVTKEVEGGAEIQGMETIDLTDDTADEDQAEPVTEDVTADAQPDVVANEAPVEDVTEPEAEPAAEEAPAEAEATDETVAEDSPAEEPAEEVAAEETSDSADAEDDGDDTAEAAEEGDDAKSDDDGDSDIESVASEDDEEEVRPVRKPRPKRYKIQEVIKVRQVLLVQVVKEERGNKGAALTTYLSLAGRYCVLMPNTARGGGISRKITNAADRKKLKEIANEMDVPEGAGLIIRTAGAQRTKAEVKRDYEYLQRLWEQIRELTLKSSAPAKIYEEGDLIKRTIRDLYSKDIDEVIVAGEGGYRTAKDFMKMIMPSHAKNVKPYVDQLPLFARYQVEGYLSGMFNPVVQLPSGGYIVIGVTEALVAVDVNSGRATKEGSIEQTALKTNLEAADEVARQLRLRDLAGLIVIDFIDMDERKNNTAVEKRMKDKLKTDRARIQVGRISGFGLMEMSRQRLRPGMLEATTQPCPHCHGTGLLRSDESVALSILRQLEEEGVRGRSKEVLVKAPIAIANFLMNQKREHIADIEARYGLAVRIECDPSLVSPDFAIEKFKTATRIVPESAPVVTAAAVIMDDEDDADVVDEVETTDEEEGEAKPKKRRRRRRRRRGGSNQAGDAAEAGSEDNGSDDNASDEAEAEAKDAADAGETAAEPEADAPVETPAEAEASEPAAEEKPKPKRTRSRKKKTEVAEEDKAEAPAEPAEAAEAEPEDKPKPKRAPRRRSTKKTAEAEAATEEAPAEVAEEKVEEKPKRKTTRRKKAAEPVAEAEPAAAPASAPEAETAEPAVSEPVVAEEPAPAEPAAAQAEPEPAAEAVVAEAVAEPIAEPKADEPPKPKRRGWWSLNR